MTTKQRKNKGVIEPFSSIYVSFVNRYAASFLGTVAQVNKKYIVEKDLFERMMVWSFVEERFAIPESKEFSKPTEAPYIRITKLYDNFKNKCRRHKVEPCSFKIFKNEIAKHLEICFAKRAGHQAVYLVDASHPLAQLYRNDSDYESNIFNAPFSLDVWSIFGRKPKKYNGKIDIKYSIRGGINICLKKDFKLEEEGI